MRAVLLVLTAALLSSAATAAYNVQYGSEELSVFEKIGTDCASMGGTPEYKGDFPHAPQGSYLYPEYLLFAADCVNYLELPSDAHNVFYHPPKRASGFPRFTPLTDAGPAN